MYRPHDPLLTIMCTLSNSQKQCFCNSNNYTKAEQNGPFYVVRSTSRTATKAVALFKHGLRCAIKTTDVGHVYLKKGCTYICCYFILLHYEYYTVAFHWSTKYTIVLTYL